MTTNMRNAIEQAAYEIGVATAKYEMLIGSPGMVIRGVPVPATMPKPNITKIDVATPIKGAKPTARGVKKAAGPRTPGVKKGILNLIAANAMSTARIIEASGFNDNSVRATLMSLKKAGLAMNDDGLWIATAHVAEGNSETIHQDADF